jgi:putative inorganic carbon (HCO3(-)) transporter
VPLTRRSRGRSVPFSATANWSPSRPGARPALARVPSPGVAAGGRSGAALRPVWDPLLIAVATYLLVAVCQIQFFLPWLVPLRVGVLAALASLVFVATDRSPERRLNSLLGGPVPLVAILLAWAVVDIPFALYPGLAYNLVVHNFAKSVILCVVLALAIRNIRDVENLAFVYFTGIVVFALYVVLRAPLAAGAERIGGGFGSYDPNDFAALAVTAIPLGVFFWQSGRKRVRRWLALAALVPIMGAIVRTGSRGGFLGLLAVTGILVARYRWIPLRWRLGSVAVLALVAVGTGSDAYWNRMKTILSPSQDYNVTSEVGRTQVWKRGLGYAWDRPLTGVGPDNFEYAEGTISPLAGRQAFGIGVRWTAPHNTYVQVVAELGIPGLLLFLAMLGSGLRALRSLRSAAMQHHATNAAALADAIAASLIGMMVAAFFLSHAYTAVLYTLLAFAAGCYKARRGLAVPAAALPTSAPPLASRRS